MAGELTVRYFAGARAAAGATEETAPADLDLDALTDLLAGRHGERMAAVLRAALAPPPPSRRRTKPTKGSQERRIQAKKQRSQLKKQRGSWD